MKILKLLLTLFLVTSPSLLFGTTLKPSECEIRGLSCSCFSAEDTRKLSAGITELKTCRAELMLSREFLSTHKIDDTKPPFYKEPTVIFGGIVVSFGVGGLITYLLMRE
jgi:hypothetical protein